MSLDLLCINFQSRCRQRFPGISSITAHRARRALIAHSTDSPSGLLKKGG
ncbi:hypothetical protein PSTG_01588 [Puccinia striiformis f. sp. tritici PST-78]|uniref:Uncharacterized protein n=2 Tax=Puccinia striiformis TaxID=27350 RepID=A0A0L0W275_9BASI|nr:hypothetical protein PSTG_01588 [Puccinia striiformis f. sp. tritici PST-78]